MTLQFSFIYPFWHNLYDIYTLTEVKRLAVFHLRRIRKPRKHIATCTNNTTAFVTTTNMGGCNRVVLSGKSSGVEAFEQIVRSDGAALVRADARNNLIEVYAYKIMKKITKKRTHDELSMETVTLELSTDFTDTEKKTLKISTICNKNMTKMYLFHAGGETQRCIGSSIVHLLVWK